MPQHRSNSLLKLGTAQFSPLGSTGNNRIRELRQSETIFIPTTPMWLSKNLTFLGTDAEKPLLESVYTRVQGKEIASLVEIDHWRARVVSIQIYTNHCICSAYGTSTSRIRLSQSTALAISFPCTRVDADPTPDTGTVMSVFKQTKEDTSVNELPRMKIPATQTFRRQARNSESLASGLHWWPYLCTYYFGRSAVMYYHFGERRATL